MDSHSNIFGILAYSVIFQLAWYRLLLPSMYYWDPLQQKVWVSFTSFSNSYGQTECLLLNHKSSFLLVVNKHCVKTEAKQQIRSEISSVSSRPIT